MSVWLIRHTRVLAEPGLCYGRSEVALAPSFAEDAEAVRAQLGAEPELIWCSPSVRCQRLALALGGKVMLDERLWELNFGVWERRRWESFHGPESEYWSADPWTRRPPDGESGEDLEARVAAARAEILATARGQRLAVVTHGGVVRAWRRLAEGLTREQSMELSVPFGSVWSVD